MGKFYLQTTGELIILHPFCIRKVFLAENSSSKPSAVEKKMQISGVKTYKGHCIYQPKQNRKIPHKIYRKLALHCFIPPKKRIISEQIAARHNKVQGVFFSWCDGFVAFWNLFHVVWCRRVLFLQVAKKNGWTFPSCSIHSNIWEPQLFRDVGMNPSGKTKCRPKSSSCIRKTFLCISYVVY